MSVHYLCFSYIYLIVSLHPLFFIMAAFNNWLANLAEIGQCEPVWASSSHHWLGGCSLLTHEKVRVSHCLFTCLGVLLSHYFFLYLLITILKTIMPTYFKNLFKDCFRRTCSRGATTIYASVATLLMLLLSSPPVTSVDSNGHFSFLIVHESLNSTLLQQKISSLGSVIPHPPGLSITLVKTVFPSLLLTSASLPVF